MKKLPEQIHHHPDVAIPVVEEMVVGAFGYLDAHANRIVIDPAQLTEDKWVILFHELLHLVESTLLEGELIKRRVTHDFITHAAPLLFGMLAMSGLLEGFDPEQAKEMVRGWIAQNATEVVDEESGT